MKTKVERERKIEQRRHLFANKFKISVGEAKLIQLYIIDVSVEPSNTQHTEGTTKVTVCGCCSPIIDKIFMSTNLNSSAWKRKSIGRNCETFTVSSPSENSRKIWTQA